MTKSEEIKPKWKCTVYIKLKIIHSNQKRKAFKKQKNYNTSMLSSTFNGVFDSSYVQMCWYACKIAHLCHRRISNSHLRWTVHLFLIGHLHRSGPLIQEAARSIETTVPYARLPLKVLTLTITVVEVTQAGLIFRGERQR